MSAATTNHNRAVPYSIDVWILAASAARREWLMRSVGGESGIRVVGVASTFPLLRSMISETPADLALIDLQFNIDSAAVNDWIAELVNVAATVVLTPGLDPAMVKDILNAQIGGILSADASAEQIRQAIRSVASGLMVFDADIRRHLIPGMREDHSLAETLTPREREVLELLASGLGNKQIAIRLDVSEHTIKFHIRSILGKLGASSRTEAVTRGLRSGLIEL